MKKLIALLLSVLLALTSMAPAYAAKPYLENQNFSILACMTFLYSEEELGKRMLTIDSLPAEAVATFQKEDDINIQETYEMVLEDQHCIVLLKFVSTESLQSNQEQAVTRYRASVIDFFEESSESSSGGISKLPLSSV